MTTETDSFTYSNGELASVSGGNWLRVRATDENGVVSNKVQHSANGNAEYYWHTSFSSGTSLYSQVVFDTLGSGWEMGPAVNLQKGASSLPEGYVTIAYDAGGGSVDLFVNEYANGTSGVQLGSTTHPAISAGDTIKITDESGTIKCYQNGSVISGAGGADATWGAVVTVGFYMDSSSGSAWRVDNWEGGDIAAGGQPTTKRMGGVQFTASRAPAQQGMRQF